MGKGGERGKRSRPLPSSILDMSSSPQDFVLDSSSTLCQFLYQRGRESICGCHCSHCKIHLVCRLCMRLVIIEERGRVVVGEACGQALQLWRAKRAAILRVSFRVTPPNEKLARRLEHALCNMPGRGCWLITEGLKKMYWT